MPPPPPPPPHDDEPPPPYQPSAPPRRGPRAAPPPKPKKGQRNPSRSISVAVGEGAPTSQKGEQGPRREAESAGGNVGTVHRWNPRGFCFIKTGDGEDLFCHASALPNGAELPEGTHVEFDKVYDDRKGKYRAEGVTIVAGDGGEGGRRSRGRRGRGRARSHGPAVPPASHDGATPVDPQLAADRDRLILERERALVESARHDAARAAAEAEVRRLKAQMDADRLAIERDRVRAESAANAAARAAAESEARRLKAEAKKEKKKKAAAARAAERAEWESQTVFKVVGSERPEFNGNYRANGAASNGRTKYINNKTENIIYSEKVATAGGREGYDIWYCGYWAQDGFLTNNAKNTATPPTKGWYSWEDYQPASMRIKYLV